MVPLLAPGVSSSILKGPLSGLNALSCDNRSQIHQLVTDVSSVLPDVKLEPAAAFQNQVDTLASYQLSGSIQVQTPPLSNRSITEKRQNHSQSTDVQIIKQHFESEWKNDFVMRAYCEVEQKKALNELLTQSYDDIPEDVITSINEMATREWPDDFVMRLNTLTEQIKAYRKLHA